MQPVPSTFTHVEEANLQETLSYFLGLLVDQLSSIDLGSARFFDLATNYRDD